MEEDEPLGGGTEGAEVESCATRGLGRQISVSEFLCHCCYDVLVNPTTLNCGHSFCRHCLALWWVSSKKNECPECREKWEGFPKVNILLRDVIEKLFSDAIEQRKEDIQKDSDVARSLATFQKYGNEQMPTVQSTGRINPRGGFFSGVLTALTCVAVVLLGYHWSSREFEDDLLIHKPVAKWTAEEVILWLEQLGPWASHYKERFLLEKVNGRLLLTLTEEDFTKEPYSVENSNHRRAIMAELECVKTLGVKPPQNLWEYKAVNPGKSLFLLYALKSSPRLSMLYLYLFDYTEAFLPFIHTICPMQDKYEDAVTKLLDLKDPSWRQWREFTVKYLFLPYQLIAEFAWDWLDVHYWTSRFIIVNAMLLSVLELVSFWRLWSRRELNLSSSTLPLIGGVKFPFRWVVGFLCRPTEGRRCPEQPRDTGQPEAELGCGTGTRWASGSEGTDLVLPLQIWYCWALGKLFLECKMEFFTGTRVRAKTIPHRMWSHFWKVSTQGLFVAIFWPFIPQFVCNCLFYWALYFNPVINIDLVVTEVRRLETQVQ